jgi:FG-GAP repeat protein
MRKLPIALVLLTGCVWSKFDELRDDVWVDSVEAIEGSAKYGEAVMEGTASVDSTTGGSTIGVLGRNQASVSFLVYDDAGNRTIKKVDLGSAMQLVTVLDENPVYAADPDGDQIVVAALTGSLTEQPDLRGLKIGLFRSGASPTTGEGVNPGFEPPGTFPSDSIRHEAPTAIAFGGALDALVGRKGQLAHVDLNGTPGVWTGCHLDPGETAYAIGYGDVDGLPGSEYIIASAPTGPDAAPDPGRVWIIPEGSFPTDDTGQTPCPAAPAGKEVDSGGASGDISLGAGSQLVIAPVDFGNGPRVLVSSPGAGGKISIIDFTAATATFTQIATPGVSGLDSFAVANVTGDSVSELIVGAPLADAGGSDRAGEVRILNPAGAEVAPPLSDAEPQTEQHFGKSVAVVPFRDRKILVVGAEGEVFTYFRTNFYDEVRTGR